MSFKLSSLSNGLPVVTCQMDFVKTIAINLIVSVGSRYESEGEEGISHFLEHMAFKGTKTRSAKKIAEEFDAIGGQFNAYTSKEQTVYYAKVLEENIEQALDILSDIILNSTYAEEEIKKEFQVICQEIAQVQDNPDDLGYENLIAQAFNNQPLGKSILGTEETIAKFNRDSFKNYVSKHYTSGNIVLSAAGNVKHDAFVAIAEKKLNSLLAKKQEVANPSKYNSGLSLVSKELEQSNLFIGFNSCSFKSIKEFYHTQIMSLILGGGLSSRLFQSIREKSGLAYSVGSFNSAFFDNGIFSLYAGTAHEKVPLVLEKMAEEAAKIRSSVTEGELLRAKAQIRACIAMSEEKTSYKSEEVGKNYSLFRRFISTEEVLDEVNNTTISDITNIADKVFSSTTCLSVVGSKTDLVDYEKVKKSFQ